MTAIVDITPYGSRMPGLLDRTVLAITASLPANWIGLRMAALFRRIVTRRLGERGMDAERWGLRLRLYPRSNGCEKNLLFTPQMYDVLERRALATAMDQRFADGGTFTFVDVGANVGLYSLFVAAYSSGRARVLAIEPQPGIVDRFRFNLQINADIKIDLVPVALGDREGETDLVINARDSGGTHVSKDSATTGVETVRVRCRRLVDVVADFGILTIDALKIDVEGAEDLVLAPFLRAAPQDLLPRWVLIEDTHDRWHVDVFALLQQRGYVVRGRSRHNVVLTREASSPRGVAA